MAYYAQGGQYPFFTVLRRSITAVGDSCAALYANTKP
jgi:hypothetical protein